MRPHVLNLVTGLLVLLAGTYALAGSLWTLDPRVLQVAVPLGLVVVGIAGTLASLRKNERKHHD